MSVQLLSKIKSYRAETWLHVDRHFGYVVHWEARDVKSDVRLRMLTRLIMYQAISLKICNGCMNIITGSILFEFSQYALADQPSPK